MLVIVKKYNLRIAIFSGNLAGGNKYQHVLLNPFHENWQNWGTKYQKGGRLNFSSFF